MVLWQWVPEQKYNLLLCTIWIKKTCDNLIIACMLIWKADMKIVHYERDLLAFVNRLMDDVRDSHFRKESKTSPKCQVSYWKCTTKNMLENDSQTNNAKQNKFFILFTTSSSISILHSGSKMKKLIFLGRKCPSLLLQIFDSTIKTRKTNINCKYVNM